jgi:hypothetical protein
VEDQDKRTEDEDVEAHRRKATFQASDEPSEESEGDDVEAHRKKASFQAGEEAPTEGDDDDDFELHGKSKPKAL